MSSNIMPPRRPRAVTVPPPKKRRKVEPKIEEITFNVEERQDYLSGFHRRKLQRQKQAKAEAVKREREEKLAARKSLREGRKADLEKHVEAVNAMLRKNEGAEPDASEVEGEEKWDGTEEEREVVDLEEYVDDDKFTTVTVEAVDVSRDGLKRVIDDVEEDREVRKGELGEKPAQDALEGQVPRRDANGKRIWTKERPRSSNSKSKSKSKKRQFNYESKADRKITRFKERGKNKKQAKERKGK